MKKDEVQPKWLEELEQRVRETYLDVIKTSISRTEHHKKSSESLEEAVRVAHKITLDFLARYNWPMFLEESDEETTNI